MLDALPGLSEIRATPGVKVTRSMAHETGGRPAKRVSFHYAARDTNATRLLDARTAALDQDDKNDDKQDCSSNSDDHGTFHIDSSFPQW